jgi:hypothetical protein
MRQITKDDIEKRLLTTDRHTGIPLTEVEVIEISPSGENIKVRNMCVDTTYWIEKESVRVVEELPANAGNEGRKT